MKRSVLAILFWLAIPVEAQTPPVSLPTEWKATSKTFWHASIDYPVAASGGLSLIIGKERATSIRGYGQLRGMLVNAESGPGGFTGRLGFARLFQYDAGVDGFSIEAVYVRPWLLRWGLQSGEDYVGPGVTYRFGYLRVSGAAVVATNGTKQVRPSVTIGIAVPFRLKK